MGVVICKAKLNNSRALAKPPLPNARCSRWREPDSITRLLLVLHKSSQHCTVLSMNPHFSASFLCCREKCAAEAWGKGASILQGGVTRLIILNCLFPSARFLCQTLKVPACNRGLIHLLTIVIVHKCVGGFVFTRECSMLRTLSEYVRETYCTTASSSPWRVPLK